MTDCGCTPLGAVPAALALIAVAGTEDVPPEHKPNFWIPVVVGLVPIGLAILLSLRESR